mgnify:CR=1 FL=1
MVGVVPGDVIDQYYYMRVAIEALDDGVKSFLACSIPEFEFDIEVLINFDDFGVILNSESDRVVVHELVSEVPLDQAALATA